jgi:antitoxin MazE
MMQVAKWGNSLAIRIPAVVAEALELKVGDEGWRSMSKARGDSRSAMRGRLPADFVFDRDEAHER